MARAHWPTEDPDHQYIEDRIQYFAQCFARKRRLSVADREDIAQDLRLNLLIRLGAFDPNRATRRTFIARLVEHGYSTLVKRYTAAMRNRRSERYSLDAPANDRWPSGPSHGDALGQDQYDAAFGRNACAEETRDLALSLTEQIQQMPEPLKEVCMLMYNGHSASEIAQLLGIHRSTLYDRLAKIRLRLKTSGFEVP